MTNKSLHPLDWPATITAAFEAVFVPPAAEAPTCATAINAVCLALEKAIAESPLVRDFLAALPKGPGTSCPNSPIEELAKMLAYRRGEVDQSDARVWANFLETYMVPVFAFRDNLIFYAVLFTPDSTAEEIAFLDASIPVARATDKLWFAWLRRLSIPYRDLPEAEQAAFRQRWDGQLPTFDYTVYTHSLTELTDRVAWATAFPEEIQDVIINLLVLRKQAGDEWTGYYLDALMLAYAETDVALLEQRWTDVDEAWIKIPADNRFVPVHGMENYEHPYGVSPEFRLTMRVTDDVQAREIAAFRAGSQQRLTQYDLSDDVQRAARAKLASLDIGVFMAIVEGGVCLDFRLAGQVVPNRQTILARGGKVFISDPAASDSYIKLLTDTVNKHCTPEAAEVIIALLSTFEQMRHTLGHECFHPVGCTPGTAALLGSAYNLLEEGKATVGGLITADDLDSSLAARQKSAAASIARILRFMHKSRLEDASVAPYVRENLVVLDAMLVSKVLWQDNDGWIHVDLSEGPLDDLFTHLREFIVGVIGSYQVGDTAMLEGMRIILCGDDDRGNLDEAKRLIAWINRTIE
jgi:hypothetical protein